jgi:hypothetical protein
MNHRDEVSVMNLRGKENRKTIVPYKANFNAFDYASILILNGPENFRDRLSAIGKLNIQLGV